MKERIIEFLKAENKSSAQFAEEIGVQPSGISHILSGRNNPSLDFVIKMLERYKFLSVEWLLFGKGLMYRDKTSMPTLFEQTLFDQKPDTQDTSENPEETQAYGASGNNPDILPETTSARYSSDNSAVKKIVWFYGDGSFEEYYPRR